MLLLHWSHSFPTYVFSSLAFHSDSCATSQHPLGSRSHQFGQGTAPEPGAFGLPCRLAPPDNATVVPHRHLPSTFCWGMDGPEGHRTSRDFPYRFNTPIAFNRFWAAAPPATPLRQPPLLFRTDVARLPAVYARHASHKQVRAVGFRGGTACLQLPAASSTKHRLPV